MNTKLLAVAASAVVVAPTALLAAAVAAASPYDPTTTVAPQPTYSQTQPTYSQTYSPQPIPTPTAAAPIPTPVQTVEPIPTPTQQQTAQRTTATQVPTVDTSTVAPGTTYDTATAVPTTQATVAPTVTTATTAPPATTIPTGPSFTTGLPTTSGGTRIATTETSTPQTVTSPAQTETSSPTTGTSEVQTETSGTPTEGVQPRESSTTSSTALPVPEPQAVTAQPQAVDAAKVAPAAVIDPALPPPPPVQIDFNTQVAVVIADQPDRTRQDNFRPQRWDYVDYDEYHRPNIYNPLDIDVTYRYFYDGDYREVYVPHGGRITLNITIVGVFPFTAVGVNFVSAGYFNGGCWVPPDGWYGPPPAYWQPPPPPVIWTNVNINVVNVNRTVVVNKVVVVGHDDNRPVGRRDALMLDDTTLAYGEVHDGRDGGTVDVSASQALPGVGPLDNGAPIVNTALMSASQPTSTDWTPWLLGGALVVLVGAGAAGTYVVKHPKGPAA